VLSGLLVATSPPAIHERFPDEGTPAHALLVVDVASGDVVRVDDSDACRREPVPFGTGRRFLTAVAALESGDLDAEETVRCDSTCWARGDHGEVALVNALAWGCDTYAASLPPVTEQVRRVARSMGLDVDSSTLEDWTGFWRRADRARLPLRAETTAHLLATATTTISSPRGVARPLHDPRRVGRAFVGEAAEGSWVTGVTTLPGGRRWAFALFVPGGTARLAVARCAHLLAETKRTFRAATRERGGKPWSDLEE
jgi:hypothetical protein